MSHGAACLGAIPFAYSPFFFAVLDSVVADTEEGVCVARGGGGGEDGRQRGSWLSDHQTIRVCDFGQLISTRQFWAGVGHEAKLVPCITVSIPPALCCLTRTLLGTLFAREIYQ